jgi:hypothetical protein
MPTLRRERAADARRDERGGGRLLSRSRNNLETDMSGGEQPASCSKLLATFAQNERLPVEFLETDDSSPSEQMRGADEQHVRFTEEQLMRQPITG